MPTFPLLKTGAVAQYPLERTVRRETQTVRFFDGSRQSYPLSGTALRSWVIRLDLLDEAEVAALDSFADQQRGAVFAFTDPVTGSVAQKCVISRNRLDSGVDADQQGWAEVTIEEVL